MRRPLEKLKFVLANNARQPQILTPIDSKTLEPKEPSIFPPESVDSDVHSEWELCGWTLEKIIIATLCGEARGEVKKDPTAANVVYATIRNRMFNGTVDSFNVERGNIFPYGSATPPLVNKIFQKYAYSIWNDESIFESCDTFSSKMKELMCDVIPTVDYNIGIARLIASGMTQKEAANTMHYLNTGTATSEEPWVVSATASKNKHLKECSSGKAWRDVLVGRKGIKFNATLVCIGRHLFVSGVP
jgi:hypothetical protein